MNPNKTQLQQVRNHLLTYKTINSWTAIMEYKITRLSQYILLLRKSGFNITMKRIQTDDGKWYGKYSLIE